MKWVLILACCLLMTTTAGATSPGFFEVNLAYLFEKAGQRPLDSAIDAQLRTVARVTGDIDLRTLLDTEPQIVPPPSPVVAGYFWHVCSSWTGCLPADQLVNVPLPFCVEIPGPTLGTTLDAPKTAIAYLYDGTDYHWTTSELGLSPVATHGNNEEFVGSGCAFANNFLLVFFVGDGIVYQ
jgi:hypothetical protein